MILLSTFLLAFALSLGGLLLLTRTNPEQSLIAARFRALCKLDTILERPSEGLLDDAASASWGSRLLARSQGMRTLNEKLKLLLLQAQSEMPMSRLLGRCAAIGVAVAVVAWMFMAPVLALVAGAVAGSVPMLMLHIRRRRRIEAFNANLPDVIDMMARSLRAGHAMVAALAIISEQAAEPARTEFAAVYRKQGFGITLRQALYELLDRVPSQDLRVLVTGILVQKDTGGNLAEILDRIVAVIRERLKIQGEIRIHTAQGRLTGWILCLLPVALLVIINLINPGYSKPLTDNAFGRKLLGAGAILLVLGALMIRRIISSIEV